MLKEPEKGFTKLKEPNREEIQEIEKFQESEFKVQEEISRLAFKQGTTCNSYHPCCLNVDANEILISSKVSKQSTVNDGVTT